MRDEHLLEFDPNLRGDDLVVYRKRVIGRADRIQGVDTNALVDTHVTDADQEVDALREWIAIIQLCVSGGQRIGHSTCSTLVQRPAKLGRELVKNAVIGPVAVVVGVAV